MTTTVSRTLALSLSLLVASSALVPIPAFASENGRRNTTYALGALTAVLLAKKKWIPAAIAAGGTYIAYHNYKAAVNARHRRERALAYRYSYSPSYSSYQNSGSSYSRHHNYSSSSSYGSSSHHHHYYASSHPDYWSQMHARHLALQRQEAELHQRELAIQQREQQDQLAQQQAQLKAQQSQLALEEQQLHQQATTAQATPAQTVQTAANPNDGGISKAAIAIPSGIALLAAIGGGLLLLRRNHGIH